MGVRPAEPEKFWIPLIGFLSGMRLNEICQLHTDDVVTIDGVPCFDVNDAGDKQLKTASSRRVVPIHPQLMEIGLLDYVARMRKAGHQRLWMNLTLRRDGYAQAFSNWFQRFNRAHITDDPRKVFHSFRHTVADTLKQKGVAEPIIAELLGHAATSITMGRYGKRFQPRIIRDALSCISLPSLAALTLPGMKSPGEQEAFLERVPT